MVYCRVPLKPDPAAGIPAQALLLHGVHRRPALPRGIAHLRIAPRGEIRGLIAAVVAVARWIALRSFGY